MPTSVSYVHLILHVYGWVATMDLIDTVVLVMILYAPCFLYSFMEVDYITESGYIIISS